MMQNGWTVHITTRDGGENFFHTELLDLLHSQFGVGMYGVEYHSEFWSHPDFPPFWKVEVHVMRPNADIRALLTRSVHSFVAERETLKAGISEAARLALFALCEEYYYKIGQSSKRHYPRRHRGQLACRVAPVPEGGSHRLRRTVDMLAALNSELMESSVELRKLRLQAKEDRRRIEQLTQQISGRPVPPPFYPAFSPPREYPVYGGSRTRLE
jgi:hypothetical protein